METLTQGKFSVLIYELFGLVKVCIGEIIVFFGAEGLSFLQLSYTMEKERITLGYEKKIVGRSNSFSAF